MLIPEVPSSCLQLHYTSHVLHFVLLSCPRLFLSLSLPCAWWLVKKGPDNSALVSTSLLSSSPSLVAFGELRPFCLEIEDALGSIYTYYLTIVT